MPDQPTNEELAAKLASGERSAFVQLLARLRPGLEEAVKKSGFSETETREIVESTWCKVWENRGQFEPSQGSFIAWVVAIARNIANDSVRKSSATIHLTATMVPDDLVTFPDFPAEIRAPRSAERIDDVPEREAPSFAIEIDIPNDMSDHDVVEMVSELAVRIDDYCVALGGKGIRTNRLEVFEEFGVPDGVPSTS